MEKITAKFINDNLVAMSRGEHVFFRALNTGCVAIRSSSETT